MKITKKELKRIAEICSLDFSSEEYTTIQHSLQNSSQQDELIYQSSNSETGYAFDKTTLAPAQTIKKYTL